MQTGWIYTKPYTIQHTHLLVYIYSYTDHSCVSVIRGNCCFSFEGYQVVYVFLATIGFCREYPSKIDLYRNVGKVVFLQNYGTVRTAFIVNTQSRHVTSDLVRFSVQIDILF